MLLTHRLRDPTAEVAEEHEGLQPRVGRAVGDTPTAVQPGATVSIPKQERLSVRTPP